MPTKNLPYSLEIRHGLFIGREIRLIPLQGLAADGGDDDKYDMTRDNRAEPPPLFDIWVVTTKHLQLHLERGN